MKKTYEKPEIMFESFVASANIAGNCEVKTWTPNSGQCAYIIPRTQFTEEIHLFVEGVNACVEKPADGMYNGFCYHIPTETNNLFNS